jgi:hypothetical protein
MFNATGPVKSRSIVEYYFAYSYLQSVATFNQRFIFPLPFAMKIMKINLWNQGILVKSAGYF